MLKPLRLGSVVPRTAPFVPKFLEPLVALATDGQDLAPALVDIARGLGFTSYMQGVSLSTRPNADSQSFVYTTLPMEWVTLYDQKAYLEVDPRIQYGIESGLPFIWDRSEYEGRSERLDQFLEDAARFGVSSGISISLRDPQARGGVIALSSSEPVLVPSKRAEIESKFGLIMVVGQYIHELFVAAILARQFPSLSASLDLTPRERQCVQLAANGMTSFDIGIKLGITERTVNYHFSNIITKMNVLNRREAIAKAVAAGIARVG